MKNKYLLLFISLILLLYPITSFSSGWSRMESGTNSDLNAIWGSSGTDLFAVGGDFDGENFHGTILHYDGDTWSPMVIDTTSTLVGIWGSSGKDVFAVGYGGTIVHYNGTTWRVMSSWTRKDLYGVWGSSGSDVFAVGVSGTILHYNGSNWSTMSSGTTNSLFGVWGSSGRDVFAVGYGGTILHYNRLTWSAMSSGTKYTLRGVWGCSINNVFAVGDGTILHYNGLTWSAMEQYYIPVYSIWGSAGSDVFAVSHYQICTRFGDCYDSNATIHYNGVTWSVYSSTGVPPDFDTYLLNAVWGSSSNDVFEVGSGGTILRSGGIVSTTTTVPGGSGCPAKTVMGEGSKDLIKLRDFRNEMFLKTEAGKRYTIIYYKHALELSYIFTNDQALKEKANSIIQKIMPAIEELLARKVAAMSEDTISEAIELIDALRTQSGPELEKGLNDLKKDIQEETILKTFKVKIRKN